MQQQQLAQLAVALLACNRANQLAARVSTQALHPRHVYSMHLSCAVCECVHGRAQCGDWRRTHMTLCCTGSKGSMRAQGRTCMCVGRDEGGELNPAVLTRSVVQG